MSPLARRAFIAIDEWLGIFLCVYLWRVEDYVALAVFAPLFVVAVYVISYPSHWRRQAREARGLD